MKIPLSVILFVYSFIMRAIKLFIGLFMFGIMVIFSYGFAVFYSEEEIAAYDYASSNRITNAKTIEDANMKMQVTRIEVAKMISRFAKVSLNIDLDDAAQVIYPTCEFLDVDEDLDYDYNYGVTYACKLGLMGQNIQMFRPHDYVTRAEFGTILSRLLNMDTSNLRDMNNSNPYYKEHLEFLQARGIMNDISNPSMNEIRGNVMIMLMRTLNTICPKGYTRDNVFGMGISCCDDEGECFLGFPEEIPVEKPIIYLYPTIETEIKVKLGNPERLSHTYPRYNPLEGRNIIAQPNGDLRDLETGRGLYALYWEGISYNKPDITEGFVVKGEDTISFLEEKLAILGLNEHESEEFIVYWLPQMENNPYNLIRFETIEEQNEAMPLNITPSPDSVIRVMMDWKPIEELVELPEQQLETTERNGFTVVEWGGGKLN